MTIIVNGDEKTFESGATISKILQDLGITDMVMACAVNTEIVKKDNWNNYSPNDGDKIEFLEFVGGG